MNRCELLQSCASAGVTLRIESDALRYRAPRGAMTADLRAALLEHKPDVLHDYHERAAIMEFDGGLDQSEAERLAAADVLGACPGIQRRTEAPIGSCDALFGEDTPCIDMPEKTTQTGKHPHA